MLAVVVAWQALLIGRSYIVGPPLPEPARLSSTAMLEDPVAPTRTPPAYDLTIFVFSDYQCPSCRLLHPDLENLVTADGHIRLVYKDWVVFGDRSRRAARLAIAAQWQGRHAAANDLFLHGATGLDDGTLAAAAAKVGINWGRLQRDLVVHSHEIDDSLERTDRQARSLGIPGTPTLVIGGLMFSGRLAVGQLEAAVRLARHG
jgi:protein-disulfide isomerase